MDDRRAIWSGRLEQIVVPVFEAAAQGRLRAALPVEQKPVPVSGDCSGYSYLEAFCRSLAGIAPWLENGADDCSAMRDRVRQGLERLFDRGGADFPSVENGRQCLVEAAFLSSGLMRCRTSIWEALQTYTREAIIAFLVDSRRLQPAFSNWLLFPAMVEAFFASVGRPWDRMRVELALRQHEQWYHGDGAYGDGPHFQWDYYNSIVIQPMLHEILAASPDVACLVDGMQEKVERRLGRYAEVLERLISPEGTFPPIGRSLAYRTGAFHALAYATWRNLLPEGLAPTQVRCALGAVIERVFQSEGTFDTTGWLQIGLAGHQPGLGEAYISTGSLYACTLVFLPLGLTGGSDFWAGPDTPWTAQKLWSGMDATSDHSLRPDPS